MTRGKGRALITPAMMVMTGSSKRAMYQGEWLWLAVNPGRQVAIEVLEWRVKAILPTHSTMVCRWPDPTRCRRPGGGLGVACSATRAIRGSAVSWRECPFCGGASYECSRPEAIICLAEPEKCGSGRPVFIINRKTRVPMRGGSPEDHAGIRRVGHGRSAHQKDFEA